MCDFSGVCQQNFSLEITEAAGAKERDINANSQGRCPSPSIDRDLPDIKDLRRRAKEDRLRAMCPET